MDARVVDDLEAAEQLYLLPAMQALPQRSRHFAQRLPRSKVQTRENVGNGGKTHHILSETGSLVVQLCILILDSIFDSICRNTGIKKKKQTKKPATTEISRDNGLRILQPPESSF